MIWNSNEIVYYFTERGVDKEAIKGIQENTNAMLKQLTRAYTISRNKSIKSAYILWSGLNLFGNKKGLTKFVLQNIIISKSTLIYDVRLKDIIKNEIVPYLPLAKRGFQVTVPLEEIVNRIFYKLKTGVQCYQLPVKALFDGETLTW